MTARHEVPSSLGGRRGPSLTTQSLHLIFGRLVGFAFAFGLPIVLVRLLDQVEFGTYKQFLLVAGFLIGVLPLGLHASLFYFIPQDPPRAGNYLLQTSILSLVIGVAAGVIIYVLAEPLAGFLNSPLLLDVVPFLAFFLALEMVGRILERTVIIERQVKLSALVFGGSDALKALALIGPAVVTREFYWVAVGAAGYALARALALVVWAIWRYGDRFERSRMAVRLGEQLNYALPFGGGNLVQNALLRYHAFYVAALFSPGTFAIYSIATQPIPPVQIFFGSLFEVALVRMTEYFVRGDWVAMRVLWNKLIASQAAVVMPMIVGLCLLAVPFVETLFTALYLDAVPVFRVSLLLLPLTMLNDHVLLRACANTRFILVASLAGLGASLVAVPALTYMLGLTGAALGLVLGVATMKAAGLLRVRALLHLGYAEILPWSRCGRYLLGSVVAALLVYPFLQMLQRPFLQLTICGTLFWLSYVAVAWVGNLFSEKDKRALTTFARSARVFVLGTFLR